jgi:DNA invertase Pin-like site-specific DNA recombinase
LLSSLAKLEAQKISEPTKAGMARAKANGSKIGRPKLGIEIRQKITQRAKKGETPYAIAKALGIDRHTAAKYALMRGRETPPNGKGPRAEAITLHSTRQIAGLAR